MRKFNVFNQLTAGKSRTFALQEAKLATYGPLRQPDSVRGLREKPVQQDEPESVRPPAWLSAEEKKLFRSLVVDLIAAKVPLKQIDCHAVGMAAHCLEGVHSAQADVRDTSLEPKQRLGAKALATRYERDAQRWLEMIGATPIARARLGIRPQAKKEPGKLAQMLLARQARVVVRPQ